MTLSDLDLRDRHGIYVIIYIYVHAMNHDWLPCSSGLNVEVKAFRKEAEAVPRDWDGFSGRLTSSGEVGLHG